MQMNNLLNFVNRIFLLTFILFFINSCSGLFRSAPSKDIPVNEADRVAKNMAEGKGFRLSNIGKKRSGGDFQFASSNPLWRASLEKLSFAPLSNVDYAGGIIVTDWFSEENSNEQIKITVRFLTNEIRSDAINVIIHKKVCSAQNNCKITKIDNNLNSEIKFEILKKAAQIKNEDVATIKKETGEYKIPKNF